MLLFDKIEQGTQHVGGDMKQYKDKLKATLKRWWIRTDNEVADRATWRAYYREGVDKFGHSIVEEL